MGDCGSAFNREGFEQTLHSHPVKHQTQAATVEGIQWLQQTRVLDHQNMKQTIHDVGLEIQQSKAFPKLLVTTMGIFRRLHPRGPSDSLILSPCSKVEECRPHFSQFSSPWSFLPWSPCMYLNVVPLIMLIYLSMFFSFFCPPFLFLSLFPFPSFFSWFFLSFFFLFDTL